MVMAGSLQRAIQSPQDVTFHFRVPILLLCLLREPRLAGLQVRRSKWGAYSWAGSGRAKCLGGCARQRSWPCRLCTELQNKRLCTKLRKEIYNCAQNNKPRPYFPIPGFHSTLQYYLAVHQTHSSISIGFFLYLTAPPQNQGGFLYIVGSHSQITSLFSCFKKVPFLFKTFERPCKSSSCSLCEPFWNCHSFLISVPSSCLRTFHVIWYSH